MSDEHIEPGELTERFRAFTESEDPKPSRVMPIMLTAGAVAAVVVVIVLIAVL